MSRLAANENLFKENDSLFEYFFDWLAGQYDDKSGGFYYARSSFHMNVFIPDIESTAMALNIIQRSGLLESMPDEIRVRMIRFFQNKQDSITGYFYDADEHMPGDEVMVMRALGFSTGSLRKLEGHPIHLLPRHEQVLPDYLHSPAAYSEWLRAIDLRNSWRGCDLMGTPNHHLQRMSEIERKPYIEEAVQYFDSIQDPDTGLWGEGSLYIRISGTFKLRSFYRSFGVPIPHMDRIYQSMLTCLRTEEALDMCWVRNPMDLLGSFHGLLEIPEHDVNEILEISLSNLSCFRKPDGGFSRELAISPPAPNVAQVKEGEFYPYMPKPVKIGQGLAEGDMNAGTQAIWIRELCQKLAGLAYIPLSAYTDNFWQKVLARVS